MGGIKRTSVELTPVTPLRLTRSRLSGCRDDLFFEKAEGSWYDQVAVESIHEDAGGKEGTVIFHDLHTDAKIVRQMIAYDVAFFQMDALCHPD